MLSGAPSHAHTHARTHTWNAQSQLWKAWSAQNSQLLWLIEDLRSPQNTYLGEAYNQKAGRKEAGPVTSREPNPHFLMKERIFRQSSAPRQPDPCRAALPRPARRWGCTKPAKVSGDGQLHIGRRSSAPPSSTPNTRLQGGVVWGPECTKQASAPGLETVRGEG